MDGECAFCAVALRAEPRQVFCEDCGSQHLVCSACADEVATSDPADGYRLIA